MSSETCIFCRIVKGEIPANIAYQDEHTLAFHDIDPRAPVHVLIIPRLHVSAVNKLTEDDTAVMGRLFQVARQLARELGVADSGYRMVVNNGADAGQSVDHIHMHVLGGRTFTWPPG
jgi:histidine triad (HIT) family protein